MTYGNTNTTMGLHPLRPSPDYDWDTTAKAWVLKPLADIKTLALQRIDQAHGAGLETKVGLPTAAEKDTWSIKLETAKAIAAKTAISTAGASFLTNAGISTDAAKTDWATRVLANADAYAVAVGKYEKWRTDARAAISAATTYAALQQAETTAMQGILNIK